MKPQAQDANVRAWARTSERSQKAAKIAKVSKTAKHSGRQKVHAINRGMRGAIGVRRSRRIDASFMTRTLALHRRGSDSLTAL